MVLIIDKDGESVGLFVEHIVEISRSDRPDYGKHVYVTMDNGGIHRFYGKAADALIKWRDDQRIVERLP